MAKAKDFSQLAKDIIAGIGGKENVSSVTHCVTRVRFILKDDSKADDAAVGKLKGVMKVIRAGGQYQVVIGAEVNEVYDAVLKEGGFKEDAPADDELVAKAKAAKGKDSWLNRLLGTVSAIFAPVLGALTAAGMIKALLVFLTLVGILSKESGTYLILNAVGDAPLYFFPVMLGWSAARRFGLKDVYGIIIGGALVIPHADLRRGRRGGQHPVHRHLPGVQCAGHLPGHPGRPARLLHHCGPHHPHHLGHQLHQQVV